MIIGIPKEIKNNENRVSMTPAGVFALCKAGHRVYVETMAGTGSGFNDDEYKEAGAIICSCDEVFAKADLIVKVKEYLESEYKYLCEDQMIFTYLHIANDQPFAQALIDSKTTAIAYETVELNHNLPLLTPMSEVAGRMAVQIGANMLQKANGGSGLLLGGVPGVMPAKVVEFGGVVPEIASRQHVENISNVAKEALKEANMTFDDIDIIACTYGPGLVGALLVGVSYAKGLSYALNKPLVGTNHIEGHIAANYITNLNLKPPFLCLVVSGGHTHLVHIKDYKKFEILGKTRDDAIGEAFDKVARVIGLGYPGGPKVDKLAKEGTPNITLPKTRFENLDFSFSGIKTAVINLHHKTPDINKADLCASFEKTVTEELLFNTLKAAKELNINKIALAGGVSANSYIRKSFENLKNQGYEIYYPEMKLCTDNAAMIASAGYYNYINGKISDLTLNAIPNLKLE